MVAIVTDNASNMEGARQKVGHLEVFTYGCQAHLLNPGAKDLLDKNKAVFAKIVDVMKAFRNVHALANALGEKGLRKPPLPCETRWCSARDTLEYYDKNWTHLADIATNLLRVGDPHRTILENMQIRRATIDLFTMLDPVGKALNQMQEAGTNLATAVEIWLDLIKKVPIRDNRPTNCGKE